MPAVTNAQFLEAIFGADWPDAHVTGFAEDPGDLEKLGLRHLWAGYRWRRGHRPPSERDNTYFTISLFRDDPVDGRAKRRKELFRGTHCIVVDDVGTKVRSEDVMARWPAPSWTLETSPGNYQWGYILDRAETDAGRVNALLDGMIAAGLCADGKDPGMKGVTRYVRLPEGRNTKAKYGVAGGFECRLVVWEPERRFEIEDLAGRWGIALPVAGACGVSGGGARTTWAAPGPGNEIWDLMDRLGMIKGPSRDGEGYECTCPWAAEHTGGLDDGAVVWVRSAGVYVKCHHGHCADRGWRDLQRWADEYLQDESGGLVRLSPYSFPVVEGYRPPNAGARGGVVRAGTGIDFGTGREGAFFGELIYVKSEDRFYDLRSDGLVLRIAVDLTWGAGLRAQGVLPVVVPRTGETMKPSAWFFDEANTGRARVADEVTYWPGEGRFFEAGDRRVLVNRWRGTEGTGFVVGDADVEPWLGLVRHLVGVEGAAAVDGVLDWMALVVGEPGLKPGWHVVVQGGQGIGKDMMIQPVKVGVGDRNVGSVNASGLHGNFNAWAERRLVVVNELKTTTRGSSTGADQYNALKEMTENTNKTIKINQKNQREYYARNVGAFYVTSNHECAIALEADDRRFLVVMAGDAAVWTADQFAALGAWQDAGGNELVADWLRDRWVGMGDARRRALLGRAPMTRGKARMISNAEDPVVAFMRDQIETGVWPDLMTAGDIGTALSAAAKSGAAGFSYVPPPNRWGSTMRTLGGAKVYNGSVVRMKSGQQARVWAVRDPTRFSSMGEAQIAQAYVSAAGHAFSDASTGGDKTVKLTPPQE